MQIEDAGKKRLHPTRFKTSYEEACRQRLLFALLTHIFCLLFCLSSPTNLGRAHREAQL